MGRAEVSGDAVPGHAAQFTNDGTIALFELTLGQEVKVLDERHYQLVPADKLDKQAIRNYRE